jgi:hypothetical protein
MLCIPDSLTIKTDKTPLRYQKMDMYGSDTFLFRCSRGHLGKYNLPVSSFKGFEGTVKERLRCTRRGCDFNQWVFLEEWKYTDEEASEVEEEKDYIVVDNQHNLVVDNQGHQVLVVPREIECPPWLR